MDQIKVRNTLNAVMVLFLGQLIAQTRVLASEKALSGDQKSVSAQEVDKDAKVFFVSPKNQDKTGSKVMVKFGVTGYSIAPAGKIEPGKGHHHLIIDGQFIEKGQVVPSDATHIHFGKGQGEAEIMLTPGKHKLTLQLADGAHISYGEKLSSTIDVEVVK